MPEPLCNCATRRRAPPATCPAGLRRVPRGRRPLPRRRGAHRRAFRPSGRGDRRCRLSWPCCAVRRRPAGRCTPARPRGRKLPGADAGLSRRPTGSSARLPSSGACARGPSRGSSRSASTARTGAGHDAWRTPADDAILPGVTDFFQVEGEEVHEVAVGPGPRGRHRAGALPLPVPRRGGPPPGDLPGLPAPRRRAGDGRRARPRARIHYMETLAGDTTIGHATAYCQAAGGPGRLQRARRGPRPCAASRWSSNGWPTTSATWGAGRRRGLSAHASFCGRIRGDFLNMTALALRQPVRPRHGPARAASASTRTSARAAELRERLRRRLRTWPRRSTCSGSRRRSWRASRRRAPSPARPPRLGLVGVAARACGLERDVRFDFPVRHLPVRPDPGLDLARAATSSPGPMSAGWRSSGRRRSSASSSALCRDGAARAPCGPLAPDSWRSRSWRAGAGRSATSP